MDEQGDKSVFKIPGAGLRPNGVKRALSEYAAVPDNNGRITQGRDFLHHVTGKKNARAGVTQPSQQFAQGPYRHYVETIRRFIEDEIARRVHECTRYRHFDAFALRETLGAPICDRRQIEQVNEFIDP